MPSPFPGMDPYLEGPLWTTLHFSLAAELVRQLAPRLRPRYLVLPVERFVLDTIDTVSITTTSIYPDVGLVQSQPQPSREEALTIATAPLRLATVVPEAVPHVTIEIRNTAERTLVTAIEILSPTNKRGQGRVEYLAKREGILLSTAHLLEIDLLRQGQRVPMREPLPSAPYFVFLSRGRERPFTEVWPISQREPLPVVPVPLLPDDADAPLDLQLVFTNVYDLLNYDLVVDYRQPPAIPLDEADAVWAEGCLQAAGLR
jgi:hypothetical protein